MITVSKSNVEYLVFVGRIERNFAALLVGGAEFGDFADRQFDTLE